jgi:hypothetical protein
MSPINVAAKEIGSADVRECFRKERNSVAMTISLKWDSPLGLLGGIDHSMKPVIAGPFIIDLRGEKGRFLAASLRLTVRRIGQR